jgi:chromosome segregation ATPase
MVRLTGVDMDNVNFLKIIEKSCGATVDHDKVIEALKQEKERLESELNKLTFERDELEQNLHKLSEERANLKDTIRRLAWTLTEKD